jgi:hypothetical protein
MMSAPDECRRAGDQRIEVPRPQGAAPAELKYPGLVGENLLILRGAVKADQAPGTVVVPVSARPQERRG